MKPMTFPLLLAVLLRLCQRLHVAVQTDDQFAYTRQTNYYAFNHAFTDQAEAAVRTKAEARCAAHVRGSEDVARLLAQAA